MRNSSEKTPATYDFGLGNLTWEGQAAVLVRRGTRVTVNLDNRRVLEGTWRDGALVSVRGDAMAVARGLVEYTEQLITMLDEMHASEGGA